MVNEEIVPIGDIKTIIDKTAVYVAKLGDSFVNKVKLREGNNPKFNFFNDGDQYNAYYKNQVAENKAKLTAEVASKAAEAAAKIQPTPTTTTTTPNTATTSPTTTSTAPNIVPVPTSIHTGGTTASTTTNENKQTSTPVVVAPPPPPVKKEPTQPDPLLYILDIPDFMTPLELDTMRLTAQFVAKNGDSFFHELSNREVKNQQFDFLKPTNHLYEWFRALVESYAQIIYPPMAIKEQLKSPYFTDKQVVLERSMNRCEYNQSIEMEKQKKEEQEDQEKSIIASIDWHDFVIVDTIEFNEDDTDDLPAPKSFDQLISGDISSIFANNNNSNNIEDIDQDNQDMIGEDDDNEMEMEMEMDTDDQKSSNTTIKDVSKLKIVKDYQKPSTSVKSSNAVKLTQICQFCKQEIPLSEMQEHMRIELIQKQQRDSRNTGGNNGNILTNTLSSDDDIARNLQSFASKRADIFGESEHQQKKQEQDQNQAPKVIWDGHSGSIPKVQAAAYAAQQQQQQAAQQQAQQQQQKQLQQQAAQQQQQQQHYQPPQQHFQSPPPIGIPGMMPPPFGIPGMMPPMPPFGIPGMMPPMPPPPMMFNPNQPQQQIQIEEPNSKKIKIDDQLIPESMFLQSNPQPVKLICEMHDKSASYEITVQPTDLISSLKEQIKQKNGLATNKQKLQAPGLSILKDTCSIAFYNLRSNTIINVGLKERGGKKK